MFAQLCFVGINPNIAGTLNAPDGPEASVGTFGDTIYYFVNVSLPISNCPHKDISGTITLPDGTVVPLPAIPDLLPGEVFDFGGLPVATYVIDATDLGNQPGADADEVRAVVNLEGTAVREGGTEQSASGTSNYDTTVVTGCVEVTKTPDCDVTILEDNVYYIIRIENCGDTDLELDSITDPLFPGLVADASCQTLAPGEFCEFSTPNHLITESDPDPLVNTVTVVYNSSLGEVALGQVTDDDDAEIDIVHPDFTVTKECTTPVVFLGDDADFEVVITNTGDVELCFETDDPAIGPFCLNPGEDLTQTVNKTATECPTVENTISVTGSFTGGEADCQTWEDTRTPEGGPAVCDVIDPEFTVEKVCLTDPITGPTASFEITITNTTTCGDICLDFEYTDPAAGIDVPVQVGPICVGEPYVTTVEVPAECVNQEVSNTVYVEAFYNGESLGTDEATAVCPCGGGEGCTPGFWKNSPNCWACYSPTTTLNQVFDFTGTPSQIAALGNDTLLTALSYGGGTTKKQKLQILMRHAVAAILNACSGDVEYPDDVAGIVAAVNGILANWNETTGKEILSLKGQFADWNELGCPISSQNSRYPCQRKDESNGLPI
jgi:hypothetical protein